MKQILNRENLVGFCGLDLFGRFFCKIPDAKNDEDILYSFYDLAVSPVTFNIIAFLILAEIWRKKIGCRSIHVVIVLGLKSGFREDSFDPGYDTDNMWWRLKNILVPCCWMMPSCEDVTVFNSRKKAMTFQDKMTKNVFPRKYTVKHPIARYMDKYPVKEALRGTKIPSLQPTPQALKFARDWIDNNANDRKIISITLRESLYDKDRNSSLRDWSKFVQSLDTEIYCPVVIRDTEASLKSLPPELENLLIFREAPWNIDLRLAFYELCYLNLFVSNGPGHLLFYDKNVSYIFIKVLSPLSGYTEDLFYRQIGLKSGSQTPWATPFQQMVWKDDKAETILEEFNNMCAKIEQKPDNPSKV